MILLGKITNDFGKEILIQNEKLHVYNTIGFI